MSPDLHSRQLKNHEERIAREQIEKMVQADRNGTQWAGHPERSDDHHPRKMSIIS